MNFFRCVHFRFYYIDHIHNTCNCKFGIVCFSWLEVHYKTILFCRTTCVELVMSASLMSIVKGEVSIRVEQSYSWVGLLVYQFICTGKQCFPLQDLVWSGNAWFFTRRTAYFLPQTVQGWCQGSRELYYWYWFSKFVGWCRVYWAYLCLF